MHLRITYRANEINLKTYGPIKYINNNYVYDFENKQLVIGYYFFINRIIIF